MALQYQTIRETDLGAGIDQQSAENRIQPGYSEDLENADPKPTGYLTKRTGYQGYAGHVPVRVKEITYTEDSTNNITLILDDSIDMPVGQSQPLIILGKTSSDNTADVGDFTQSAESIHYYSGFLADIRKTVLPGTNAIIISQNEHDITTKYMFVGISESTSTTNNSNSQFAPDIIAIDGTTKEVSVTSTNSTGSSFDSFIYLEEKTAVAGSVYQSLGNVIPDGGSTVSISAATHALDNNNIIVKSFQNVAGNLTEVIPDNVFLGDNSGDIDVEIDNNTGGNITVDIILSSAPTANFLTGSVAASSTESIVIDTTTTGGSEFAFIACYLETPPSTTLEQIIPDSIVTNAAAGTTTVTFTNNNATGANFEIYWEFATISTNSITISGSTINIGDVFTDTTPQLTIWGLCHADIYGTRTTREGWTSHIDSYRAPGETRLISGLGGNLFAARLRAEGANASDYLMPLLYPRLNERLSTDTIVGPAFYDTTEAPGRTRGFITGTDGGDNFFTITTVAYNTGTGFVDYTISIPSMVISGTLSTIISTVTGLEDKFTAQQCGYSVHNGTFTIKAVASGVDTLTISVSNSLIDAVDYDEADVGGDGGIFTDQLTFTGTSPFLTADILTSDLFDETLILTTINTVASTTVTDGLTEVVSLPGGLRVVGERTSYIIPLRDFSNTASITNVVRGDMLTYTDINRQVRILSINQLADTAITITADGTSATVVLGSNDTNSLFIGKKLLIAETTSYNGTVEVESIVDSTTFTFSTSLSLSEAGNLVGNTIEVDESLNYTDTTDASNFFTVHSRWIPIEIPLDNFDNTPKTRIAHFDSNSYSNQAILRSTMVQNNLYLTNEDDEVLKFDGADIYRAGLFRWQPNLFTTTDTTATGVIELGNPTSAISANSTASTNAAGYFFIGEEDRGVFQVGDTVQNSFDESVYTVKAVIVDDTPTNAHVYVDRQITAGTTTSHSLTKISTLKYYFRLNAIDANNNIVASAATGSDDFVVRLSADAAVNIKLVGMPTWDIYDYDRLEVQIYRTKSNSVAPFYLVSTLALDFDLDAGYIEYTDTTSDDFFTIDEFDPVNSKLKGVELGTAWTQPMRAKYCTSAGNRLILGNLKDYPNLDMRILKTNTTLTQSVFIAAANKDWLFRKDNTDALTTTDMINRASYEFRDVSTGVTITGISGTLNTSFVITATNTLSAGDWVYLFHSTIADADKLTYAGWWQVASANGTTATFSSKEAGSGAATNFPDKMLVASTSSNIPVSIGTDGNYSMSNGNRTTTQPYEFLAMRRLADAINCTMRKTNEVIDFQPWMIANAGNEFNSGELVIRQPKIFSTNLEVQLPSYDTTSFAIFANNIKRAAGASAGALTRLFPSRIIASYSNFPEIFDNPTDVDDAFSDSAIDINSADGQEITAIIPFFGDAAFGAAQKSGIVVVFKTNSVYLVDLAAKDAGQNAVQKLETRGKGCTAPYSVSVTRGGIMFANNTGIYRLNRNLTVDFIGRKYERKFISTVNKSQLDIATGHHDAIANSYKLSYPISSNEENSEVAVYNHTREYETGGDGSWTTYNNHPSTGWANLDADSYFATTDGRVHIVRRLGEISDYRDDASAIALVVLTRALDAMDSGRRKIISSVITHFRVTGTSTGTTLKYAMDLKTTFKDTDDFQIDIADPNGLGDSGTQKVITIRSSIQDKVGVYIQIKYENNNIDEPVEITGIDFRVAAKTDEGILEAAET